MGRGLKDVANIENSPYDFVDAPGMLQLRTAAGIKSPVEVSADILRTLRQRAEALIEIAHPDFQDQLVSEAKEHGLL